jgi:hypothetical protein
VGARFTRRGDRVVGRLSGTERAIVAGLIGQTRDLLAPEVIPTGDPLTDLDALLDHLDLADEPRSAGAGAGVGDPPGDTAAARDPALARLLPDAHRGDPTVAAEFRALAEQDLRQRKYQRFTEAIRALQVDDAAADDRLELTKAQAETIAIVLTDVRLLLADRLGLHTDDDIEALERAIIADAEHDLAYPYTVYDFLTWLQDSMVGALTSRRFLF